jgi:hypothetical protein
MSTTDQKCQPIHVSRYTPHTSAGYAAAISPEDRSWTLFVPADGGVPDLWVEVDAVDENGATVRGMVSIRDYADPRLTPPVEAC